MPNEGLWSPRAAIGPIIGDQGPIGLLRVRGAGSDRVLYPIIGGQSPIEPYYPSLQNFLTSSRSCRPPSEFTDPFRIPHHLQNLPTTCVIENAVARPLHLGFWCVWVWLSVLCSGFYSSVPVGAMGKHPRSTCILDLPGLLIKGCVSFVIGCSTCLAES